MEKHSNAMQVRLVYNLQQYSASEARTTLSLFLCGPSPRETGQSSYRGAFVTELSRQLNAKTPREWCTCANAEHATWWERGLLVFHPEYAPVEVEDVKTDAKARNVVTAQLGAKESRAKPKPEPTDTKETQEKRRTAAPAPTDTKETQGTAVKKAPPPPEPTDTKDEQEKQGVAVGGTSTIQEARTKQDEATAQEEERRMEEDKKIRDYTDCWKWELDAMALSNCLVFSFSTSAELMGLCTRSEWGMAIGARPQRNCMVCYFPADRWRTRYQEKVCSHLQVPMATQSMEEFVRLTLDSLVTHTCALRTLAGSFGSTHITVGNDRVHIADGTLVEQALLRAEKYTVRGAVHLDNLSPEQNAAYCAILNRMGYQLLRHRRIVVDRDKQEQRFDYYKLIYAGALDEPRF